METKIHGSKKRPRIVLAGEFDSQTVQRYMDIFPSVLHVKSTRDLTDEIHPREIDILIIAPQFPMDLHTLQKYTETTNVICFSTDQELRLPGPLQNTQVRISRQITSEEYILSPLTLQLNRIRESQLEKTSSVKNWFALIGESTLPFVKSAEKNGKKEKDKLANENLSKNAIILERHEKSPLAVIYTREDNKKNYAWLPNSYSHQIDWVMGIAIEWAKVDSEAFPTFGNWVDKVEWMTVDEQALAQKIADLEEEKNRAIQKINNEIQETHEKLELAKKQANDGMRRLITEQGDLLVEEVANVFEEMGFSVSKMDSIIESGNPKKEDLRLSIPNENSTSWDAIVEVRGYTKSSFQTSDITRISRFAMLYLKDKEKLPDKRIYVVNGQIDLQPPFRERPFASAKDDLEEFSKDNGLVIWTVELFRAIKTLDENTKEAFRESIIHSTGYWSLQNVIKI